MFAHHLGAIERGEPIEVGRDGTPELNPIHIDDAVGATVRALALEGAPDVINLAGPDIVSIRSLVALLAEAIGRTPVVRETDRVAPSWAADIDRMTRVLGPPRIGLAEGIRREFQVARD
jgi:nucleoside-diphosphate-sugar epimerase